MNTQNQNNQIITTNRDVVFQSNSITESHLPFTKTEADIFCLILSVLKSDVYTYNISVDFLINELGIRTTHYKTIVEAIENLYEKSIDMSSKTRVDKTRVLSRVAYDKEKLNPNSTITITLAPDIIPYIYNLKKNFTVYEVHSYLRLNKLSSKALYGLFAQYKVAGRLIKTTDEIQKLLGTNYKRFTALKNEYINPALKEIQEKTNVNSVIMEPIKNGRTITAYRFLFDYKSPQMTIPFINSSFSKKELDKYSRLVDEYRLSKHQANSLIENIPLKELNKTLYDIQLANISNKIETNIGAYTIGVFNKKYGMKL